MELKTVWIGLLLATAALAVSPSAEAHECANYSGCDASNCPEGEDHDHTDYNRVGRDGHCESSSHPEDPNGCSIFGIDDWPELVCDLIDGRNLEVLPVVSPVL